MFPTPRREGEGSGTTAATAASASGFAAAAAAEVGPTSAAAAKRAAAATAAARVRVALRRLDEEAGAIFEETFGRFGRRAGYGEREAGESGERSSSLKKKKTSVGRKEWRGAR